MVIGEDPDRIEFLYQKMYRQSFWRVGVIGMSAISGIEQALWDIQGKLLNRPVYQLLGGAVRDKVRMYTHLGGGDMRAVYETQYSDDPQIFVERALAVVEKGYTAVKVLLTPPTEALNPIADYQYAERVMAALREAVGNEVRKASPVPIATGERLVTRFEFRPIFQQQACHVIQPDLCHCGGLWEAKKIAAMAEIYYMGVAPHNPLGPVANAAALHFALSTPNFLIQEDMLTDVPWRWEVVQHSLQTEKGYWLKTDAPGLGIEVNEAAAKKHPFQQEVIHATTVRAHDGAILDW
jgi:galactonate dehydratase